MAICCDDVNDKTVAARDVFTIALAGNPNSGKTTLFNALTGLRQKVGNYPGITVERKVGRCRMGTGADVQIIDLPGTYSLISRSPDEVVAMQVLRGLRPDTPRPDVVIVVVDASNLQRNLYLVSQLIDLGCRMVVALNMMDIAKRRGLAVSAELLSAELGVPVIPVVAHKKEGIEQLKAAIEQARTAPMPDWTLPEQMKEELIVVGGGLAIIDSEEGLDCPSAGLERVQPLHSHKPDRQRLDRYRAIAERLLIGDRAEDLLRIASRQPVVSMLASAHDRMVQLGVDPMQADVEAHYRWIEMVSARCVNHADAAGAGGETAVTALAPAKLTVSERVDYVLVHRFWGLIIFAGIMATLFVSIFWLADPIMGGIEAGIGALRDLVTSNMAEGPLKALMVDGVFAGVGGVVVFVPQIALLFLFLSILEDSGYLARAAFLMDRLLSRVGLHGKSFIPLLSSFACAIPGVMATRTIEHRTDRLATILVTPFMSCSARLPVYTLLIGVFFADYSAGGKALIMLSLYAIGVIAAAGCAYIFKRSLLRGPTPAFILELPSYKLPQPSQVGRAVWTNAWEFLRRAGTIIFSMSILLWAMSYYPRLPENRVTDVSAAVMAQSSDQAAADTAVAAARQEHSIAGRIGHGIEPVLRPLGYNWKIGVGLIGAFAAREVFVSTMAITYAAGDGDTGGLGESMRNDVYSASYGDMAGKPVWTPLIAASVLVWFVLAMQCMSTLAVVRRETGSWKWPIFMLAYMNALAYVVCLLMFQIGSRM